MEKEGCNCNLIEVLLLSDRLVNTAIVLSDQLRQNGVSVLGVAQNKEELHTLMDAKEIGYIIIVGYLSDVKLYEELRDLREVNQRITTVQWAMLDSLISTYCCEYRIPLKFERTLPVESFVEFLEKHKDDYRRRIQKDCEELASKNAEKGKRNGSALRKLKNGAWFREKVKEYLLS